MVVSVHPNKRFLLTVESFCKILSKQSSGSKSLLPLLHNPICPNTCFPPPPNTYKKYLKKSNLEIRHERCSVVSSSEPYLKRQDSYFLTINMRAEKTYWVQFCFLVSTEFCSISQNICYDLGKTSSTSLKPSILVNDSFDMKTGIFII
jgi:hypothetical protein